MLNTKIKLALSRLVHASAAFVYDACFEDDIDGVLSEWLHACSFHRTYQAADSPLSAYEHEIMRKFYQNGEYCELKWTTIYVCQLLASSVQYYIERSRIHTLSKLIEQLNYFGSVEFYFRGQAFSHSLLYPDVDWLYNPKLQDNPEAQEYLKKIKANLELAAERYRRELRSSIANPKVMHMGTYSFYAYDPTYINLCIQ